MVLFPHCKINLGLFVLEKRADNFHNIETVFYPVDLCDALEIVPEKTKTVFNISGIKVPSALEDNLCMKAYHMIDDKYNVGPINMHLLKNIPIGSGLGGGSSDAVFTIKLLNSLFNLKITHSEMQEMSRQLGSDCAFFLEDKPMFALEKGDVFKPISLTLKGLFLVIVVPDINVNTAMAYSKIKVYKNRESISNIIQLPIENWKFELYNDFEFPIFEMFPQIENIKSKLYKLGALYASMSGSGSAVYGIFKEKVCLENKFKDCVVWKGECRV
ncbi:MAG: 4-(cytidine 5'-diphospho)-2-C-methyl-D-erythritol kinase [Bacteroidales bacterium]|nr:4-(cytidine 5'-diphospho)-2-C-methyl-D-erythritol kinase [Bacteroidales bacterium]